MAASRISQRWIRIIPVALIMYTIALIDRTNISVALPKISRDLHLDPQRLERSRVFSSGVTWRCKFPPGIWPNTGARKKLSAFRQDLRIWA